MTDYIAYLAMLVAIYALLALSLDVLAGQLGLVSLAHAAFFGIGAYTTALAIIFLKADPVSALALSALVGVVASGAISLPALRLRGDYFIIAAFAFQMLLFSIFNNLGDWTGGPLGLSLSTSQMSVSGPSSIAVQALTVVTVVASASLLWRVRYSSFGRTLRAIRDDELLATSLGKNVFLIESVAMAISCGVAASAGSIYAMQVGYIDPTSFSIFESVLILAMVLVWKPATLHGPLLGAIAFIAIPESLRFLSITNAEFANLRQILFGLALIAIVFLRGRAVFANRLDSEG